MKVFPAACVLLLTISTSVFAAEAKTTVAFVEFQNKAGTIITTNRWTMAEDLAKAVKKKRKNIEIVPRKEILKQITDELNWNDERLDEAQEAKLITLGANHAVYASIVHWRVHGEFTNTEVQDASEANVVFLINVVDLASGNIVKSFTAQGAATGETGFIHEGDPASFIDETQAEDQMYEATEVAIDKAADILAELF